ncbi:MAG: VOC family protein [Candidatus Thiodiazotropha sp. (ex Lucinoma borealis)]|nr:VOC family protein [Candidatus Thiodiazotropha sp. (ex Lucinoma borealis)]
MKFNKLTPNLSVKNVAESVQFYQEILGFKLEMAVPDGTTRIENKILENEEYAYAMVKKDQVYLMFLNEENFKCDIPILQELTQGASVLFYIDVENIKEVYLQLKNRVEIVKALETTWYGMQELYIRDCNNYIIGFGEKA